ncbi:MAG: iron-sulfur cluster repair protein YtfE [Burkholderiales bacterium]
MNARQPTASNTPDRAEQSLGSIAVQLPGATAIFRQHKLDFCCNGHLSLRQAAQEKNLALDDLVAQLIALERNDNLPDEMLASELVDHILVRFHDVHRQQLPELIRMAHRVETVHKSNPYVPAGLASLLETIHEDLQNHMAKEENVLFPLIKSGGHPNIGQPIAMMRSEHSNHGTSLDRINTLTNDATPPQGACNTWRALYLGIGQFNEDLTNHMHLENNVLFPAFESAFAPAQQSGCGGGNGGCGCQ